jgi:hypothetical protein
LARERAVCQPVAYKTAPVHNFQRPAKWKA